MKYAGWILLGLFLYSMTKAAPQTRTTIPQPGAGMLPGSNTLGLFNSIFGGAASQGNGQPVTATFVPSNLLSSDFGGTAAPTAANDPIGLAIGAVPTSGDNSTPFGPPAPSPAPGDINQANSDAAKAAAQASNMNFTGATVPAVDPSGDLLAMGAILV